MIFFYLIIFFVLVTGGLAVFYLVMELNSKNMETLPEKK